MNNTMLGYHGDKDAPPGSEPWALWWRESIRSTANSANLDLSALNEKCAKFEDWHGYQMLRDTKGKPFATLRAFLEARPMHGIGLRIDIIEELAGAVSRTSEVKRHGKIKTQAKVAAEFGISQQQVSRITRNTSNKSGSRYNVSLHPDVSRASATLIKSRGLDYARSLAAAILAVKP